MPISTNVTDVCVSIIHEGERSLVRDDPLKGPLYPSEIAAIDHGSDPRVCPASERAKMEGETEFKFKKIKK